MVQKSEVANTKKAENPLAKANCQQSIFSSTVSCHLTKIPFDHVILKDRQSFAANLNASFAHTQNYSKTIVLLQEINKDYTSLIFKSVRFLKPQDIPRNILNKSTSSPVWSRHVGVHPRYLWNLLWLSRRLIICAESKRAFT